LILDYTQVIKLPATEWSANCFVFIAAVVFFHVDVKSQHIEWQVFPELPFAVAVILLE